MTKDERNFRWAYRLMVSLAIRELEDANKERKHEREWPAGQKWHELGTTSQDSFKRRAREKAGIQHDEFLEDIRNGTYDVQDICDEFDESTKQ